MDSKNHETISPKFLSELFSSEAFIQTNIKAAKRTERTGHETGYYVYKQIGKDNTIFTKVLEGNSDSTLGIQEQLEKSYSDIIYDENIYPIINTHFHPTSGLLPSPEDLFRSDVARELSLVSYGFDLKPIDIIGRTDKNIDLLVYQQKPLSIPEELRSQFLEELHNPRLLSFNSEKTDDYPYQIADIMKNSGLYESSVIRIEKEGNYEINFNDIKKFSYSAAKKNFDLAMNFKDEYQDQLV